jgi:starvation-inducible DNA-binding protein
LYGSHFNDYHELFDEHAEAILESIDIMAERVRRVGGTTIRSISHISQLQTIEDDNSNLVQPGEMVRILMEDNGHIAKMIRDVIDVCDENRDSPTSNLLQDILDKTERRKWFLAQTRHPHGTLIENILNLRYILININSSSQSTHLLSV